MLCGTVKDFTAGDSRITLLTSQMLVQTGRTHLNPALDGMDLDKAYGQVRWQIWTKPNSQAQYYTYPLGTPLFAAPFVWVANRLGLDMALAEHDTAMQRFLSAVIAVLLLIVLHRIGRRFLSDLVAVLAALLFVLSTTLMSTFGTALWSHNLATLLIALAVNQMLNSELPGKGGRFSPWIFGALLFAAYLTRPTALAFFPVGLGWMVWRHRWKVWKPLLVIALLEGCFILFCLDQYGVPMHSYYRFDTWQQPVPWGSHIPELLLSPSRGLFTFTPMLLLAFVGPAFRAIRTNLFWWAMLASFALHLALLSRHICWYAGYAYGPRFFAEVHPQLFLMVVMLLREVLQSGRQWIKRTAWVLGTVSITFGIFVHTRQGLFNPATYAWNNMPSMGVEEDFIAWNWHYPQFLANDYRNGLKVKEFEWWMHTTLLANETPDDAAIMVGSNDPEVVTFARNWDLEHAFGNRRILSNPGQLKASKVQEVYVLMSQSSDIDTTAGWELSPIPNPETLGQFIRRFSDQHIFLAAQGDGVAALSDDSMQQMMKLGSNVSEVDSGSSYVCHLAKGHLEAEQFSLHDRVNLIRQLPDGSSIYLSSGGVNAGSSSQIQFGQLNISNAHNGLNALVFDDFGHPLAFRSFDLSDSDNALPVLGKAIKVR